MQLGFADAFGDLAWDTYVTGKFIPAGIRSALFAHMVNETRPEVNGQLFFRCENGSQYTIFRGSNLLYLIPRSTAVIHEWSVRSVDAHNIIAPRLFGKKLTDGDPFYVSEAYLKSVSDEHITTFTIPKKKIIIHHSGPEAYPIEMDFCSFVAVAKTSVMCNGDALSFAKTSAKLTADDVKFFAGLINNTDPTTKRCKLKITRGEISPAVRHLMHEFNIPCDAFCA